MGLVTGGLSGRRFRTDTKLPEGFHLACQEAIVEAAFIPEPEAADNEPRKGWVNLFDAARYEFEHNDFLFNHILALSMRIDKKSVNARYQKIAIANRCKEVAEEKGLEKLSKAERELVEEALIPALFQRALPSVATVDLAWDLNSGEVIVFNHSDTVIDQLHELFEATFDTRLRPERLIDWLQEKFDRNEIVSRIEATYSNARGGKGSGQQLDEWFEDDPIEGAEKAIASDFLTWLWLQSEASDGIFRVIENESSNQEGGDEGWDDVTESLRNADITLWLESKLKLVDLEADESPETAILLGIAPSATDAARQGLHQGKRPVEAKIGMKIGELECAMALTATPAGLSIGGIKLPFEVKTGTDEKIFERMALLDLLHSHVKQLFQQFFLARTSAAWDARVAKWLADEENN